MKFSVEIETESHLFDSIPESMKEKQASLNWDIQVEVVQKAVEEEKKKSIIVKDEAVSSRIVSKKSVMLSSVPESRVSTQQAVTKKMSSTSELLDRLGKGKKVGIGCKNNFNTSYIVDCSATWLSNKKFFIGNYESFSSVLPFWVIIRKENLCP